MKSLATAVFALLLASSAHAVMASKSSRAIATTLGRRTAIQSATASDTLIKGAVDRYNRKPRGAFDLRSHNEGRRRGEIERAASGFLADTQSVLGVDPSSVKSLRSNSGIGHHHVLFEQIYKGVPVEFSRVKVHLDDSGAVLGAKSNFRQRLNVDVRPDVSASIAAYAVKKDAGAEPRSAGQLVIFPLPDTGEPRLAWKFSVSAGGLWRYYVDAHSGEILFRYDDRRYVCTCPGGQTCGTIRGAVYDIDPRTSPTMKAFANQRVFVKDANTWADTNASGVFCSATIGKVFTQLQGPYVSVSNFRGPSAHYDNGAGAWGTTATPVSSPHPYSNDANTTATIDISAVGAAANAVKVLPIFTNFEVGAFADGSTGEGGDITDDDEVQILDSSNVVVAAYLGSRGSFNGAAVAGKRLKVRLKSNSSGTNTGYDIAVSSFLTLTSPTTLGVAAPNAATADSGSFDWYPASYNALGLRSEFSLFYHLNAMATYFALGPDVGGQAPLSEVSAMAFVGPNLQNAFYDPDYDDLFFGDLSSVNPSDIFSEDATVAHHEYTHYVVEKIWPIQNFGQAGAISEAVADYFSASSLNDPRIGLWVVSGLGGSGALRELDCAVNGPCYVLGGNRQWSGEIHDDSVFVSQALWDLRKSQGQTCTDNAVFQGLLFFPESFQELLDSMTLAVNRGAATGCGGGTAGAISTAFGNHGIPNGTGSNDRFDVGTHHNDGFEQAVDISSIAPVSGTIFPASDLDFFTFSAGEGFITLTLDLPPEGFFYKGYSLTLFDRQHNSLSQANPSYDGANTDSGYCIDADCNTTNSKVVLKYYNPGPNQFFVQIAGGPTVSGNSNSGVHSTTPYTLHAEYARRGAVNAGIVTARVDGDAISFTVPVTSYTTTQDYRFAYAQLRDHQDQAVPNTLTHVPALATDYLLFISSANGAGQITGKVQIASGFSVRFPSVGSVSLEIFGYNVQGSTVSLGLSNALNLSTNISDAKAFNNVFNPARGQAATIKFDVQSAGRLTIRLYSLGGSFIGTIFDGVVSPGKGAADWNGRNTSGAVVASGIYLARIEGPGVSKTLKLAVVK